MGNREGRDASISKATLDAALAGNLARLRTLVDDLAPVVQARVARTVLRRRCRQGSDARAFVEDLVQDTFVALFDDGGRLLRTWNPERGLRLESFVGLIAEQRVLATLRSRRRNPWSEELAFDDADLDVADASPQNPETRALCREELEQLLDEVRIRLSPMGLELFMALVVHEESVASVCARTKLSVAAVHAWSSRLRRMIANLSDARNSQGSPKRSTSTTSVRTDTAGGPELRVDAGRSE